jgi:hypothetical protein
MYSGQFEIRSLPAAGEPSSAGAADELLELDVLLEPQAAKNDGPSAKAAAAAAPPPRSRRLEVRALANCEMSPGFIWSDMAGGVPF